MVCSKDAHAGLIFRAPSNLGLTQGLVGYWSFNGPDMSGNTAYDRSGNNNNGTLTNNPIRTEGKIGQALEFDGVNGYVSAGNSASLQNASLATMSIAAWIYPRSQGTESWAPFISKEAGTCDNGPIEGWHFGFYGGLGARGEFCFAVDYSTTDLIVISSQSVINMNQWQHVVITWDGSLTATNARLYRNGVEVSYGTQTNAFGSRVSDAGTTVGIGANLSGTTRLFDGLIDEVRIYNRALSADEIRRLYNMGR